MTVQEYFVIHNSKNRNKVNKNVLREKEGRSNKHQMNSIRSYGIETWR